MRKPRDFDSELKALTDRGRLLKEKKVRQLGELVTATGADGFDIDILAGVLIAAVETKDTATKEGWRRRGQLFFQGKAADDARGTGGDTQGAAASQRGTQPE